MQLIDLTQTLESDMLLFSPSAPPVQIRAWMSHEQSARSGIYQNCTCELTEIQLVTSVATYIDSPFHFNPAGESIEQLTLQQCVLPGVVIDCTHVQSRQPIEAAVLDGVDLGGKAVLFHTGWSRYWGREHYRSHPFLTRAVAEALRDGGARLAGVDFLVIDDASDPQRPVHVTLLNSKILIVENLVNLGALPSQGFVFHAAPARVKGAAAFPVRAYGVVA